MSYEYIKEPEWTDLDYDTKNAIIGLAFSNEVESDPEWESLPQETKNSVKSLYIQQAKALDEYQSAPEPEGFLKRSGKSLLRGGVEAIKSVGKVAELADLTPTEIDTDIGTLDRFGSSVVGWADKTLEGSPLLHRDKEQVMNEVGFVQRGVLGGIESMPQTASIWGLAAIGAGVAGPWGAAIGGLTGLVLMFGAGTYGKEYSDVYDELTTTKPSLSEEKKREISHRTALGSASFEVGTELPENLLALYTFGGSKVLTQPLKATLKNIVKKPAKSLLLSTAKQASYETTGEMIAGGGQAWVRQKEELSGPSIKEGIIESIIPALTMSLFFGGGAAGFNQVQTSKILNRLNSDNKLERIQAVTKMTHRIAANTKDNDLAKQWHIAALDTISEGKQFDFDERLVSFAQVKMAEDVDDTSDVAPTEVDAQEQPKKSIMSAQTVDEALGIFNEEVKIAEDSARILVGDQDFFDAKLRDTLTNIGMPLDELSGKSAEDMVDALLQDQQTQIKKGFKAQPTRVKTDVSLSKQNQEIINRTSIESTLPLEDASASTLTPPAESEIAPKLDKVSGQSLKIEIDKRANEAATSPENDIKEPTKKQKETGKYKKGIIPGKLINLSGMTISVENPKGSERSGTDTKGNEWSIELKNHYGYFQRTEGKDGDQIDVFIGPDVGSKKAFIVDQIDPHTGNFDEHKTLVGFKSKLAAKRAYLANYEKGWKGLGAITEMPIKEFKEWISDGTRKTKAVSGIESFTEMARKAEAKDVKEKELKVSNLEIKKKIKKVPEKSLDEQILEVQEIDKKEKEKTKIQLKTIREKLKDLPVKVDAIGYEGSMLPKGKIQVTFTEGAPDTNYVSSNVIEARKEVESILKKRKTRSLIEERNEKLKKELAKKELDKKELIEKEKEVERNKIKEQKIIDRIEVVNEQGEVEVHEGSAVIILDLINEEHAKYSKLLECLSS